MSKQPSPDEIKLEVTYNCPLACVHCSSDAYSNNSLQMSYDKCAEIINEAHEMGIKKISFSGGEPLTWDYIQETVKLASGFGMKVTIYSSGNVDDQEDMFFKLKENGLKKAIFSLYSSIEGHHELITRKRGSFGKTISAIQQCLKNGIEAEVHFVAVSQTFRELESIASMCRSLGVQKISVLRFVPQGRGALFSQGLMTKDENKELIKIIRALRDKGYNIRTGSPFNVLLLNKRPGCYAAQDRLVVTPDLRIYPCDAFKQIPAENIVSTVEGSELSSSTLQNCWVSSPYLNTVRDAVAANAEEPCSSCETYKLCLSGCLAQKFLCYNSLRKVQDPACLRK